MLTYIFHVNEIKITSIKICDFQLKLSIFLYQQKSVTSKHLLVNMEKYKGNAVFLG